MTRLEITESIYGEKGVTIRKTILKRVPLTEEERRMPSSEDWTVWNRVEMGEVLLKKFERLESCLRRRFIRKCQICQLDPCTIML